MKQIRGSRKSGLCFRFCGDNKLETGIMHENICTEIKNKRNWNIFHLLH
jgi:hypothetical protein